MTAPRMRLGEMLIDRNMLLPEQLEQALERQHVTGRRLGQILVEMGFVTPEEILELVSEQFETPHVWLRKGLVDPGIIRVLPKERASALKVIPMFKIHGNLTLGMANASDVFAMDDVQRITGCKVIAVQCREEDVDDAIREYYGSGLEMEDFVESFQESDLELNELPREDLAMVEEAAEGARIINLVNLTLVNAIRRGASDVHVEPDTSVSRIRYRIDGALQEVMAPRRDMHTAIVSRIKVMAKMDIAERRVPQDGRMRVTAEGKDVDLRVSTMPTVLGEKVVIRLLDKGKITLDINKIGFADDTLEGVKQMLRKPHGMILVTGPTGSGKTTTLYCGLSLISSIERNVVTIEDPVEYQLPIINQVQVQEDQGLTFARTLRSVLRQDPDVIMVGEIRDRDTAEVAIQAALTGHLVLSTLHTNESAGAISRLVEMGIEPFLLTSSVVGVIAQRLIRLVCPDCKTDYFPPAELLQRIGWKRKNKVFVTGRGCGQCFDSGLRGRAGVFELLTLTDSVREAILRDASLASVRKAAAGSGMRTMQEHAFDMVENRTTTLEEVLRVVFVEDSIHRAEAAEMVEAS